METFLALQRRGILERLLDKCSHLFICISLRQTLLVDENLSQSVKILVSEQIALAAMFYLNLLEWFLLIMCKEQTLSRSTNLCNRNQPTLCLWLRRKDRKIWYLLLAACANNLVDSLAYKYVMFTITNLIEPRMRNLILNQFFGKEINVQSSAMDFWIVGFSSCTKNKLLQSLDFLFYLCSVNFSFNLCHHIIIMKEFFLESCVIIFTKIVCSFFIPVLSRKI